MANDDINIQNLTLLKRVRDERGLYVLEAIYTQRDNNSLNQDRDNAELKLFTLIDRI